MKTRASCHPLTLASAFEQFLEISSFARRAHESYTEDLAPLLTEVGQQPVRALTTDVHQASGRAPGAECIELANRVTMKSASAQQPYLPATSAHSSRTA